jgi:hypothetical protein
MGWGDELMAAGEAESLQAKKVAIFSGHQQRWHEAWENNPKIARIGEKYDDVIQNGPGHRPYFKSVDNQKWQWLAYKPKPAKFYFSESELNFANEIFNQYGKFLIVEPNLKDKNESINRNWGFSNYQKVVDAIDINWLQLGQKGIKTLNNVIHIRTHTPRQMAAILSMAKGFLAPEGGLHHTAASLNIKGSVIFGGFISPMVTGYDIHNNFYDGFGCGMRVKCNHCQSIMRSISPDIVAKSINELLV